MIGLYIIWTIAFSIAVGCIVSVKIMRKTEENERVRQFQASVEAVEFLNNKIWDNEGKQKW